MYVLVNVGRMGAQATHHMQTQRFITKELFNIIY